jgi:hypothetical protein
MTAMLSPVEGCPDRFVFWCPGCGCGHQIDERWTVTGTPEKPTVRASVLFRGPKDGDGANKAIRCHLFITDGEIRFLGDCEHELAGKTVPMSWPTHWSD